MADTVTVTQIFDGIRHCIYEFTNECDGTGESAVKKIDLDNLVGSLGTLTGGERPTSLSVVELDFDILGFNYVNMLWDRQASDKLIATMVGNNKICYEGGKHDPGRGMDGTGDILITTDGASDGDSYRIKAKFKKKYN